MNTRMKITLRCLFICLCFLYLPISFAQPVILVVGDSLSAAYQIPPEQGWVNLLAKKVKAAYRNASVVNSSFVGDTTANALQRLPLLLTEHQPDIVILALGGNDGLRRWPVQKMKDNLQQLISLCQQAQAEVLLIGIKLPPSYDPAYAQAFAATFHQLSKHNQIALVPFMLENIALNPKMMLADRVHPSAEAQTLILENIWPQLELLLIKVK